MDTPHPYQLVVMPGATGRLRPVAEALLARGHRVRILTRAPGSPAAAALAALGAEVAPGDFDDPGSLAHGARGADVVVAGGTAHRAGPEGELRHGRNVADATVAAGVARLVYISGAGDGLPLFAGKRAVEEHIRALPLAATILAPVYFMENLFNPWNEPSLRAGRYPSPVGPDTVLQQVALADLAAFTALAVERDLAGERIELASDELTGRAAAEVAGLAFEIASSGPAPLFAWLERDGTHVDIPALHARFPEIGWLRFADWVDGQLRPSTRPASSRPPSK
jgi:uncharacterized protein YbjT (DUF2867 family)